MRRHASATFRRRLAPSRLDERRAMVPEKRECFSGLSRIPGSRIRSAPTNCGWQPTRHENCVAHRNEDVVRQGYAAKALEPRAP
jgi:hypothetical protein